MWNFQKSQRTKSRNTREDVLMWIERSLFVAALGLLGFYAGTRIESFIVSRAALKQFAAVESSADSSSSNAGESAGASLIAERPSLEQTDPPTLDFSLWDKYRVRAYENSIAAGRRNIPLGVLRIPKINLEVPLLDGTDELTLNHAVGRIAGTARPRQQGNIGIAGHRDGFFRGLKDVGVGDAIELQTLEGADTYIVDRIQVVEPHDVGVLQPRSVASLTLVTCYPFYFFGSAPQRYIVTASLSHER
jgi:sortase A